MKYCKIQNENIPALGLGTYAIKEPANVVCHALQLGYRHIDTAQWYENEQAVSIGIKKSNVKREDVFLVTKVRRSNLETNQFHSSVEESLRKLQTDYVDLLLIHWPHATVPLESYLEELVKAKEQGKTRFVGVSNFNIAQMTKAKEMGVPIINNQVEFHPLLNQSKLYSWMQKQNITLTAYSPLAQGRVIEQSVLKKIGKRHGKTTAQITLRWLLQKGVIAIPKTSNITRLKENFEIFDFELTNEEMTRIDTLKNQNQRLVPAYHGAEWDDKAIVRTKGSATLNFK